MTTARDLVTGTLRLIGEGGRGLADDDKGISEGLETLNQYLAILSAEGLMIPSRTEESFVLTVGQDNYTIGTGGDLNTTRPMMIETARLSINNIDYPLSRMMVREYQRIAAKNISGRPERYYYEPVPTLGLLKFDYEPDQAYTLFLTTLKPLSALANLSTVITLPNEYIHFLKYNLAPLLAPEYGTMANQFVMTEAARSRSVIERLNGKFRVPVMVIDTAFTSHNSYNINKD